MAFKILKYSDYKALLDAEKKIMPSWQIISVSFVFLMCASLLFPSITNPAIGIIIGIPVILSLSYAVLKSYDTLSYILIVVVCNHFRFYENLWNMFFLFFMCAFHSADFLKTYKKNSVFIFLFAGISLLDIIGLLLNRSIALPEFFSGMASFAAYFLLFRYLINYRFKKEDLERIFKVIFFIIFFEFAIAICQKLGLFHIDLPFLPLTAVFEEETTNLSMFRVSGSFGDFELLAEYSAFFLIFFMTLLFYKRKDRQYPAVKIFALVLALVVLILLSGTRSSLFLVVFAIALLFLLHPGKLFSTRLWIVGSIIGLSFSLMIKNGDPLGLNLVFDRIGEMDVKSNSNQSSDEVINRDLTFHYAYKRLAERPWIIGAGYTTGRGYSTALFGDEVPEVKDYHSLYLSMPVFFGWTGAFFFCLLFASTLILYLRNILKVQKGSLAFYISLGLFLTWSMLFINEYKIQFIRYPNHFFLIWFWMAVSINISKRINNEDHYLR
jgi:hypothetical protein